MLMGGGVLATVLEGILDNIEPTPIEIEIPFEIFLGQTKAAAAERLEITESQLDDLMGGKYPIVRNKENAETYLCVRSKPTVQEERISFYSYSSVSDYLTGFFYISHQNGLYTANEV